MGTEVAEEAANPATPLEVLAEIAYHHPELRATVAANPSTYPDLLEWLGALGDPAVDAALRARSGVATDEERAADPATDPAVLAELAYRQPELRATIAANPSAYDGLREWIAQVGSAPAPASGTGVNPIASSPAQSPTSSIQASRQTRLARVNAKFGPTFTLDSLVLLVAIAVAAVVSLIAGSIFINGTSNAITTAVSGAMTPRAGSLNGASGSIESGASNDRKGDGQTGESTSANSDDSSEFTAAAQPAPKPQFVPTVLIFDASGSMVRQIPSGGTRMAAARSAAITFVQGLSDNARMGLTVFGTGTGNADSDQSAGCFDVIRMIPVGPVNKDAFTATIAGIVQSGYTPLGPSMRDAAEQLAGYDTAQIVVVTDGVDTCSPPPACEVAAELHAARPGLTINTIGFAVDADEQAQEQLSCIAAAGGGEAVDAGDAAQLAARLRAITDPVSTAGSVTSTGFNSLKLGMSVEQAKAVNSTIKLGKVILDIQYADCGDATLQFKAGRLYSILPKKPAPTAEGIAPGDSLETAIALYGPATQATDSDGTYAQFPATKGSDSGYRIYFTPDAPGALTGKIVRIVLCLCGPGGGTVSEMANWQVDFGGVGPIKIGMPLSDVFTIVSDPGPSGIITRSPGCTMTKLAVTGIGNQISLVATSQNSSETVKKISITGNGGVASTRMPRTVSGVGIGSSIDEVISAYPDITRVNPLQPNNYFITTNAKGVSILFFPDEHGTVTYLEIGNPVPLHEPCN